MNPDFVMSFAGMFACLGLGLWAGYIIGAAKKMTRSEAARVMAKASWRNRG